jgi:hypothetical protein
MKQITLIVFTLISFSFQSNKSYPNNSQDDISLICSGKWHIEYLVLSGNKTTFTSEMKETSWAIFYRDGKVRGMNTEGLYPKGKWEYLKEIRAIRTRGKKGSDIQKIVSLSNNKMVVSLVGNEVEIGLTKLIL